MTSRVAKLSSLVLAALLSSSSFATADECNDKLQKAFDAITDKSPVRIVKTVSVDDVPLWEDTTEFMPPNVFRRTGKLLAEESHKGWEEINPIMDLPPSKDEPVIIETGRQSYDNGKPRYAEAEMAEDMVQSLTNTHIRSLLGRDKIAEISCETDGIHGQFDPYAPVASALTDAATLEQEKADRKAEIAAPDYVSELRAIVATIDDEGRIAGLEVSLDTAAFPRQGAKEKYVITYDDTISIDVPE